MGLPLPWAAGPADQERAIEEVLSSARELRLDGAYEEAAVEYASLLRRPGADRAAVALAAAEAHLAAHDYLAAWEMAGAALGFDAARSEAHAIMAEASLGLGLVDRALGEMDLHVSAGSVRGYGVFRAAEMRALAGDQAGERERLIQSIGLGLPPLWESAATARLGRLLVREGDAASAVEWLQRADQATREIERRTAPVWYDGELVGLGGEAGRPARLLDLANAEDAAGRAARAAEALSEIVAHYPAAAEATKAVEWLDELGAVPNPYARGLVRYHAGRWEEAIAAFDAFLADPSPDLLPSALYYQGAAHRSLGDPTRARAQLADMAASFPNHRLAVEALWQLAQIADRTDGRTEGVAAYVALADAYPASDRAAQALLRVGWLLLRAGDAQGARAAWARLGDQHPDPDARAQGLFWLGRGLLGLGETASGQRVLDQAASVSPRSFEGLRSADLRDGGLGVEPFIGRGAPQLPQAPVSDAAECEDWIARWVPAGAAPASADQRLGEIDRLLAVGWRGPAQAEGLDAIASAWVDRPGDLHWLARGLAERGLHPISIYAANRLAAAGRAETGQPAPPCVQRLTYPLAFRHLVKEEAGRHGLDPFLILALLRQESWFGSRALSPADARGLSQVIPSTAQDIARALGRGNFTIDDLYRPRESIAFGAWYLRQTLDSGSGRPLLALAGYNAGPGNARRWTFGNPRIDPDDYVEAIDFRETRSYVRTIYQTYRWYRDLYG